MINEKLIFDAAKNGKMQILANILQTNPDAAKLVDNKGDSLLMIAIRNSENYTAVNLIDKIPLSLQNTEGDTAIILSTKLRNNYVTQNLASAMSSEQVSLKNNKGDTCLLIAARKEDHYLVSTILRKAKKDFINAQDDQGNTALTIAAHYNSNYIISKLVQAGANPYIKNNKGKNAYEYSIEKENQYAISLYSNSKYSVSNNENQETVIVENSNFLEKIKLLIEHFISSIFGKKKEIETKVEKAPRSIKGIDVEALYNLSSQRRKQNSLDAGLYNKIVEQLTPFLMKAKNNEEIIDMESIVSLKDKVTNAIQLHNKIESLSQQVKKENVLSQSEDLQAIYQEVIDTINEIENSIDVKLVSEITKEIKIHKTMYHKK